MVAMRPPPLPVFHPVDWPRTPPPPTLLLQQVSELIHHSDNYPDLEYARVNVHFAMIVDDENDAEGWREIEGSKFVVSRVALANNTSRYYYNDRSSSFSEVTSLLSGHGIDLTHNRFLILQGEVEQISQMKPKGASEHDTGMSAVPSCWCLEMSAVFFLFRNC